MTGSPQLPLPPPVMMSAKGSFANFTFTTRWPAVLHRVIAENEFPPDIRTNLETLETELRTGQIRWLQEDGGTDVNAWNTYLTPYVGKPWLDIPWFFAEVYFYRRILEATRFFQPGNWQQVDPFARQKLAGLNTAIAEIRLICNQMGEPGRGREMGQLQSLLYDTLWGNRADLSLKPTEIGIGIQSQPTTGQTPILLDHSATAINYLVKGTPGRIDVITDNAGFELICDLFLADWLLSSQMATTVTLHLKAHPTFVSDATVEDVHKTLQALSTDADAGVRLWAQRFKQWITTGRLVLSSHWFWTAPLAFWEMPEHLRQELANASLVVIKGDANYRRLLGDRQWPFTTPFPAIVCYFPTPLLALRTLKSEVVAGLSPTQIKTVTQDDPEWLINGHWGLIQWANPASPDLVPG